MSNMKNVFVIALGGSVIAPQDIDTEYLRALKTFLQSQVKKGRRFVLIVGGGYVCRRYVKAAKEISAISEKEQDSLGIASTKLNAFFLKTILGKGLAYCDILDKEKKIKSFNKNKVVVGCGWSPGWSTDYIAVKTAFNFKQKTAIIIGKPDYVYTKDPDIYRTAKPIKKISLTDYLKMIPCKWTPSLSLPIDPIAARFAKTKKMQVVVAGKSLANLKNIVEGKPFKGTICF